MTEKPPQEVIDRMQRWFAIECNNQAWALAAKPELSVEERRELLLTACASAYHWSKIGAPLNVARADLLLARAHTLLGEDRQALLFARRCLDFFEGGQGEDWDLAFAHAELAYAAAISGMTSLHFEHYQKARQLGEAIKDPEDRQVFFDEFERIPPAVP
jgi:hypothetical protein